MSDLHEAAEEHKKKWKEQLDPINRSDTSLLNFMHNYKVSVMHVGDKWIAKTEYYQADGISIRSAIANLERYIYGNNK